MRFSTPLFFPPPSPWRALKEGMLRPALTLLTHTPLNNSIKGVEVHLRN